MLKETVYSPQSMPNGLLAYFKAIFTDFIAGYGLFRFVVEFFREPDHGQLFIAWMSKGQFLSLPMILVGFWMMWYAYQKKIYDWGPQKNS